jgi:hypothetical protein
MAGSGMTTAHRSHSNHAKIKKKLRSKSPMDDQSLQGEKQKDDGDSDMPTTILPPRRHVLESKARLACLFCRGRKIACKAAVVGFGESGANGACK